MGLGVSPVGWVEVGNGCSWVVWVTLAVVVRCAGWQSVRLRGGGVVVGGVRELAASFVVPGPSGVAVRDRLKHLTPLDERGPARWSAGTSGALASRDLKTALRRRAWITTADVVGGP